jgi:hypothetical protein
MKIYLFTALSILSFSISTSAQTLIAQKQQSSKCIKLQKNTCIKLNSDRLNQISDQVNIKFNKPVNECLPASPCETFKKLINPNYDR